MNSYWQRKTTFERWRTLNVSKINIQWYRKLIQRNISKFLKQINILVDFSLFLSRNLQLNGSWKSLHNIMIWITSHNVKRRGNLKYCRRVLIQNNSSKDSKLDLNTRAVFFFFKHKSWFNNNKNKTKHNVIDLQWEKKKNHRNLKKKPRKHSYKIIIDHKIKHKL